MRGKKYFLCHLKNPKKIKLFPTIEWYQILENLELQYHILLCAVHTSSPLQVQIDSILNPIENTQSIFYKKC